MLVLVLSLSAALQLQCRGLARGGDPGSDSEKSEGMQQTCWYAECSVYIRDGNGTAKYFTMPGEGPYKVFSLLNIFFK